MEPRGRSSGTSQAVSHYSLLPQLYLIQRSCCAQGDQTVSEECRPTYRQDPLPEACSRSHGRDSRSSTTPASGCQGRLLPFSKFCYRGSSRGCRGLYGRLPEWYVSSRIITEYYHSMLIITDVNLAAIHAKRVTIQNKDVGFVVNNYRAWGLGPYYKDAV